MFLECQRWKMVTRLCRNINNVICTFSRWWTKPEIVIGLHLGPTIVAHDRMNLKCNKFYREEKQKFSTTKYSNKLSKVSTNKCDIDEQPEIAV